MSVTAASFFLYQREPFYIPRIAAVHDLCGYGNCSLGVAIPVLSAAGCDVCPVPTSLFSAHTLFDHFYFFDTTPMLTAYLDAWEQEGIVLEAIYSGFLGDAQQVAAITRLYQAFPNAIRFVDPVMGDTGVMYPTYTPELCQATATLVDGASVLTPNLTEASLLTGIDYTGDDISQQTAYTYLDALLEMGARSVILKGISHGKGVLYNYIAGKDFEPTCIEHAELPFKLHGTGDLFASAALGALMCGRSLRAAATFAANFVYNAMQISKEQPDYRVRGVSFEPCLGEVAKLVQK